jgi:hypothetical protein
VRPQLQPGDRVCAVHPGNAALGSCDQCGNPFCDVCRTLWHGRLLCVACVERALEAGEPTFLTARGNFRQTMLGLVCGIIAWVVTGLVPLLSYRARVEGWDSPGVLLFLPYSLLTLAALAAVVSIGNSLAALRPRGDHFLLTTLGLLLSVSQLGVMIGLFLFALWEM